MRLRSYMESVDVKPPQMETGERYMPRVQGVAEAESIYSKQELERKMAENRAKYGSVDSKGNVIQSGVPMIDLSNEFKTQPNVNISKVHPNIGNYLKGLPEHIRKRIVISSGNDSDVHIKGSRHYKGEAIDASLRDVNGKDASDIADYLNKDPEAKKLGLYIKVEPNRGSNKGGRHIHIQTTDETINFPI